MAFPQRSSRNSQYLRKVREGAKFRRGSIYHEVNHELHSSRENKNDNACHLEPFEEDTQGKLRERSFFNPIFKGAHEGHEVRKREWLISSLTFVIFVSFVVSLCSRTLRLFDVAQGMLGRRFRLLRRLCIDKRFGRGDKRILAL